METNTTINFKYPETLSFQYLQTNIYNTEIEIIFTCMHALEPFRFATNGAKLNDIFTPFIIENYFRKFMWGGLYKAYEKEQEYFAIKVNGSDVIVYFLYRDWLKQLLKKFRTYENYQNLEVKLYFETQLPQLVKKYTNNIALETFLNKKLTKIVEWVYNANEFYKLSKQLSDFGIQYFLFNYDIRNNSFSIKLNAAMILVNGILLKAIVDSYKDKIDIKIIQKLLNYNPSNGEVVVFATTVLIVVLKSISTKLLKELPNYKENIL